MPMKALAVLAAAALAVPAVAANLQSMPTRQFINANCQKLTDACTGAITQALIPGRDSGKIPAKCFQNRPPLPPQALDIALWLVGHHDLDNKPISEASVITAERLWPCSRAI